ncbi:Asp-tRNA(Asn)/Glu-tRNA(Gln) amidotransferase subunit GatC [Caldisericum exile]|uniref:Aspartyl/glutamyl-tRNA(Asn/Gln) amidotransferase subunit C n=1 Tax=Caldisericum exile (strain DSM 21853 / NBRC 104410 / AZM16c01) TaxID=511051 RepID=A0A7U6JGS9_CALEA|nr:Asp-tRNA(Asn)/Glu-tRNA(Gln) amidotransferase subunit GatC [Caldisericum exile]BAL80752.1 aspartyl/glutamyl-tRNA(Asn/Gln) amidotransferase subunit C [Caldisericum exile AZM16c01]
MKIDLERIEKLSALKLDESEKEAILKDLEEIIGYFENLKEVDTEGVEPMVYGEKIELFLRDDIVKDGLHLKDLEQLRELFGDGFFRVKRIIGE